MTRLIDADALKDDIMKSAIMIDDRGIQTGYEIAIELIKRQPTVDAVRHGKWIGYAGTIGAECSVCHKWLDVIQGTAEMNYCPNCGCRMDVE